MNPGSSAGPRLVPRARLHFDNVRNRHVVLVPEAVLALTLTAAEILALCDGRPLDVTV